MKYLVFKDDYPNKRILNMIYRKKRAKYVDLSLETLLRLMTNNNSE